MGAGRWLILADDLTGAADTAIAFARAGWTAAVGWGGTPPDAAVLAIDADSRRLAPAAAAARHAGLLDRHRPGRDGLFKKIDSTLRGQPAAELAGTLAALCRHGPPALALVAPAFPALGRTTEGGCIRLHGQPLEATPLWAREHSYPSADLRVVLAAAGLRVGHLPRDWLRADRAALEAAAAGIDALVCDATAQADLDRLVQAARRLRRPLLWVGTAGLARALAGPGAGAAAARPLRGAGGILVVVGSLAEASRAGAALLAEDPALLALAVSPATLCAGPADAGWQAVAAAVPPALAAGRDVLVGIEAGPGAVPADGAPLTGRLAALLRPAVAAAGGLVVTGGETALALLEACGIRGLRMIDEIEPGVPLGLACGAHALPVVTKAGAFGDAATLRRCRDTLRRLGAPESSA